MNPPRCIFGSVFSGILVAAAVTLVAPNPARACAACACGDPTLTTFGSEKPFAGRLRTTVAVRHRTLSTGAGDSAPPTPQANPRGFRLQEQAITTALTWAPWSFLMVGFDVPVMHRVVRYPNLRRHDVWGLGDITLRGRWFFWQDRPAVPRHLLALQAGLVLPTAPNLRRDGALLGAEAQAGGGAWVPSLGLVYGYYGSRWSAYVSSQVQLPLAGRFDETQGLTWRSSITGQWQLWRFLGVRAGMDHRLAARDQGAGADRDNSGGSIFYASTGLVVEPVTDLLVHATARLPVTQRQLFGEQREGVQLEAGVTYDF